MAKKKSRIGFDPLAWMKNDQESDKSSSGSGVVGPGSKEPALASRADSLGSRTEDRALERRHPTPDGIRLGDTLTIAEVGRIRGELKQRLVAAGGGALTLDGSAVEAVDTAGVQLLVAFFREARARGIALRWAQGTAPPAALGECARRLGLFDALQLT